MKVKLLTSTAKLPVRKSAKAAGSDICADMDAIVPARGYTVVQTGVAATAFEGYYIQVASRSGIMFSHGVMATAGVIDEDYTGEIMVILYNCTDCDFNITKGDRIAQLIQVKIDTSDPIEVDILSDTERGSNGLGSTGRQ